MLEFVCLPWSEVCSARVTSLLLLSNGSVQPPLPLDYIDDEPIFQVDCLLDKRLSKKGNRKETQYLVKWTGYGPEHNTWEPSYRVRTYLEAQLLDAQQGFRQQRGTPDAPAYGA